MEFINCSLKLKQFFETEEAVGNARRILEDSTRENFRLLKIAKMNSWLAASEIVLD